MHIKSIELDDNAVPEAITVKLTIREALYIAALTGEKSDVTANDTLPGIGADANDVLFETLVSDVFNRFWDGGINDARRDLRP